MGLNDYLRPRDIPVGIRRSILSTGETHVFLDGTHTVSGRPLIPCAALEIRAMTTGVSIKLAFRPGDIAAGEYWTIPADSVFTLNKPGALPNGLYLQVSTNDTVEIMAR